MTNLIKYKEKLKVLVGKSAIKETIQPIVSIIVPAYNVEKYIGECLLSLISQTFKNIEIIVINDGSMDSTGEIIGIFCEDKRINCINQDNCGLSASRNKGLELAKGEFIAFVDGDDWVDSDFIEKLYSAIVENDCDIATGSIVRKRKQYQKYRVRYTEQIITEKLQEKFNLCKIPECCYVWNKMYRAEKIKNIKFNEGVFYEDIIWTPEVLLKCKKIITVPNVNYYYRVNTNSIVKQIQSSKKQKDMYNALKSLLNIIKENNIYLSKKDATITKSIKYLGKIPIWKIKEYEGREFGVLFGFIKIPECFINKQNP